MNEESMFLENKSNIVKHWISKIHGKATHSH